MALKNRWIYVTVSVLGACFGCAAVPTPPAPVPAPSIPTGPSTINIQAPAAQPCNCSLCTFLGLDKLFGGASSLCTQVQNCLGSHFPGLEATPAMTAIADPANLKSPNPAVAAAASVKAQEDAAPQKMKALHYLASIGCMNCYPDIEKAFLAGLEDCTEAVRFEAAQDIRDMAGCVCQYCSVKSCCTPALRKKLKEMACGVNEKTGCWKESSARVRRVARLALEKCGCPPPEAQPQKPTHPEEGPEKKDLPLPDAPAKTADATN